MRASYPDACIELRFGGELRGRSDGGRLSKLLVNLLTNAVRYGAGAVVVEAGADDGQMMLAVSNEGNSIPERSLPTLFDPLTRAGPPDRRGLAAGPVYLSVHCECASGYAKRRLFRKRNPLYGLPALFARRPSGRQPLLSTRRFCPMASKM